jgi:hypothetical protein
MSSTIVVPSFYDPGLRERQPLAVSFLSQAVLKNRLAHAYLFTGRAAEDGLSLARQLAAFLNCSRREPSEQNRSAPGFSSAELSCSARFVAGRLHSESTRVSDKEQGQYCQNCRWILADKHPQALMHLNTEGSKAGKISVEKARSLIAELTKESTYTRVIIIDDANQEIFHRPAANAILKTIESPRGACVFCLFALREEEVLPTVVSRCQVIPLRNTENHVLSFWQKPSAQTVSRTQISAQETEEDDSVLEFRANAESLWLELKGATKLNGALLYSQAAKTIQDLSNERGMHEIIDLLIEKEIDRFAQRPVKEAQISKYLATLAALGEEAIRLEQSGQRIFLSFLVATEE